MDFGLAKTTGATMLTKSGATVGTVPYMSPEQARGEKVDHRTDTWSLGVVLYEMIAGRLPFESPYSEAIVYSILNEEPKPFSLVRNDVPAKLEEIVKRCLQKNPASRYQHADELLVDLRRAKVVPGKETPPQIIPRPTKFQWRNWYLLGGAALLIGLLLFIFLPRFTTKDDVIHSIAVLPFANTTGDPNTEYLSDGIAESIMNSLSQLSQLRVMARSTVFRYKDKDVDPQKVGDELGVRAVLTGRLIQQGDNLTIRTELVNVADGSALWGQQYNRKLADLFVLQEEMAKEISEKLRLKLTRTEQQQLAKRPTENLKAFQYYTQGQAYAQRRTREDLLTAIRYYEKALEEDRNYALAHAGLADAYTDLGLRGYIAPLEGRRKAEEYARKALALDENLAEAHSALGHAYTVFAPYNFSQGDRELRRGIELSPSLAMAHFYLGVSLVRQGRLDESVAEFLKARELDPLSPIIARIAALPYYFKRDYVHALELLRQANELGPPFSIDWEVGAYIQNRLFNEALAELEKAKRERKDDPLLIYSTGMVYAAQGKRAGALQIIKELEEMSGAALSEAQHIAKIHAALNERKLALTWLERGLAAEAIRNFTKDDPVWDPIRSDPRFDDLLRRMGLQPSLSEKGSSLPPIDTPTTEASPHWQNSIAVLPFKNISADKEQEYFCDGMTEQLITNLSSLPNVKVIARTSVMQFKNTDKTIQQIAQELGVAHVLEGSVRKSGNTIRVTAQLIKADDGFHLWAKDYDRQLKDIFKLQDDVSNSIVEALKINLSVSEKSSLATNAPKNTEVYELYLKGRYHWNKRTEEGFKKAIEYFQQAIDKDPNYALAYAGLADCYSLLGSLGGLPQREATPKAKAAATKALEIDDKLAEAHTSLAYFIWRDWDWSGAEREFKRSLELNPNYATGHHWYGYFLSEMGRQDEAIAEIKRAQDVDPLSLVIGADVGIVFYFARRYDQAIAQYHRTFEMDPNFSRTHLYLGQVYVQKGMYEEAIAEMKKARQLDDNQWALGELGYAYAVSGKRSEAQQALDELKELSKRRYVDLYYMALIYTGLGEKEQAFAWLAKAYEERSSRLTAVKVHPELDNLRSDPRFTALLKKMGLEK